MMMMMIDFTSKSKGVLLVKLERRCDGVLLHGNLLPLLLRHRSHLLFDLLHHFHSRDLLFLLQHRHLSLHLFLLELLHHLLLLLDHRHLERLLVVVLLRVAAKIKPEVKFNVADVQA